MPSFYVDDVDISVDEFLGKCDDSEKDKIIDALIEDGYLKKNAKSTDGPYNKLCATEEMFEECLSAIHGKWTVLTQEEEQLILKIGNRFK
jgi:hypothetical protein